MRSKTGSGLNKALPVLAVSIASLLAGPAHAEEVWLIGNDAFGTSSFNSGAQWTTGTAPSAGNSYYTSAFQLRTPTSGDWTFGGDVLTLQSGGSMMFKGPGLITANIAFDGGSLIQGSTAANPDEAKLAGTIKVISSGIIDTTPNTNRILTISSLISGSGSLLVQGTSGTVRFNNATNTWTGALTVGTGANTVLEVASIANGGAVSGLGASSADASSITLNGGTIRVTGTGGAATDRLFTLAGNGGFENNSNAATTFTSTGAIAFSGAGDRTFTLGGSNTGANTFAPRVIDNPNGGVTSFTKSGNGTWTLTADNTYTGATSVNGGVLVFSSLANLGAGTAINMGGGTLRWASGNTVDITSRAVTATANTSTFDTNGQDITLAGVLSGTGAFRKTGAGRLTLSGDNTFTGGFSINNGNVRVTNSNSLGLTTSAITIDGNSGSSGALELTNDVTINKTVTVSARQGATTIDAPHIVNVSGNNTISGQINLTTGGSDYNFESQSGSLYLSAGINAASLTSGLRRIKFSGAGDGQVNGIKANSGADMPVVKNGTGTWVIAGPSAYSGTTTVNGGTLITNTAATGTGAVTVADGAGFGVRVYNAGQSYAPSSLTIGTATGGSLVFDLGTFGNPTAGVISTGTFTPNGSVNVSVAGTNLKVGQFKLVDYNTIAGGGFGSLQLGSLPTRTTAALVNNTTDGSVDLNVTAFDFPRWTGATNANWDVNDGSGTGTTNWQEVNSGLATKYLQGTSGTDSVLFDDNATGTTTVNLTTTLTPASILVNNSTKDYTFVGTGKLSGATGITKQGSGVLTIANTGANDLTGNVLIQGGTIRLGDNTTAGAGSLGSVMISVAQGSTLALNRPDTYTFANVIGGAGSVVKQGSGTVTLTGNNADFTGGIQVTAGTLKVGTVAALGTSTGTISVSNGGTLDVNGLVVPIAKNVQVSGAGANGEGVIVNTTGNAAIPGLKMLTLTGDTTIGGTQRWDIRDSAGGLVGNGFALTKKGTNEVFLKDLGETGLGNVEIQSGVLGFEGSTTMGSNGTLTVRSGGRLSLFNNTAVNAKPIVLDSGTLHVGGGTQNTIAGTVTATGAATADIAASSTLTLNGAVGGTGSLTKAGAGTLVLAESGTFGGGLAVNSGTVNVTKDQAYTGGTVIASGSTVNVGQGGTSGSLSSGPITNNGTLNINRTDTALVIPGVISGGGRFVFGANQNFNGIVTLTGENTFTSNVDVASGGLRITNSSALGVGPKNINLTNGTAGQPALRLAGTTTPIVLDQSLSFVTSSNNAEGVIVNESGDNVIKGNFTMTAGGGDTGINVKAGTLTLEGTFASNASNRGLVLRGDASGFFNGSLTDGNGGSVRLVKDGVGTWELNGANTYTGATMVNAGTLLVNGSISGSAVTVNSGGTLGGKGSIETFGGAFNFLAGAKLSPGDGVGKLTADLGFNVMDIAPAVESLGSGSLVFELSTVADSDKLTIATGTLNIGTGVLEFDDFAFTMAPGFTGGTYTLFDSSSSILGTLGNNLSGYINGAPAQIAMGDNGNDLVLTVVPEPSAALMMIAGVGSLLGTRRMRRRQS